MVKGKADSKLRTPVSRRYKDIPVAYDSDTGKRYIFSQRIFGRFPTPITGTFLSNVIQVDRKPPRSKPFKGRFVEACYNLDNEKEVTRSVLIVNPPGTNEHKSQIKEIFDIPGVQAVRYFGESRGFIDG